LLIENRNYLISKVPHATKPKPSYRVLLYRRPVLGGTASLQPSPPARPWVRQKEFGGDHFRWGRGADQEAAA